MPVAGSEQNLRLLLYRQGAPVTGVSREAATYQPRGKSFNIFTVRQLYQCVLFDVSTEQTHTWKTKAGLSLGLIYPGGSSQHLGKWTPQETTSLQSSDR